MKARFVCLRFVACVLFLPAWGGVAQAIPILGAFSDVSAQWGSLPPDTNSAIGDLVAQPADAMVGDVRQASGALARGSATVSPAPGAKYLRSFSQVAEAGPRTIPQLPMDAWSTVRVVTQWLVARVGTFADTSAPVDARLSFDGTLFAQNGLRGMPFSEMSATMNFYRSDGMTTVFEGAGLMAANVDGLNLRNNRLTTSGDFLGLFSFPGGTSSRASLAYDENFAGLLNVIVGELFEVEVILMTHVHGLIADREANARADFYNSGGFQLSLGDQSGLTLTQVLTQVGAVPEPETYAMLLVGLGLMGFGGRHRKQKTA